MKFKKIDGMWCRLSHCGFIWRETNYTDLSVEIRIATGEILSSNVEAAG